jgi:hypothetical protein
MALLLNYPFKDRGLGITLNKLLRDFPDRLKHVPSVIAALYLLEEEGQIRLERSCGHENYLDSLRAFPPIGIDIPPPVDPDHRERYVVRKHEDHEDIVRIEFYKDREGKHFVWPYVGRVRRDGDSYRHFKLRMHFDDLETARECALNQGTMLAELGYLYQAE